MYSFQQVYNVRQSQLHLLPRKWVCHFAVPQTLWCPSLAPLEAPTSQDLGVIIVHCCSALLPLLLNIYRLLVRLLKSFSAMRY